MDVSIQLQLQKLGAKVFLIQTGIPTKSPWEVEMGTREPSVQAHKTSIWTCLSYVKVTLNFKLAHCCVQPKLLKHPGKNSCTGVQNL